MAVVVVASIMRNPILKQNQKKDIVNNIKKTIFQYLKQVVQARIMRVCTTFQVPGRVVLPKRFVHCCAKVCKKKKRLIQRRVTSMFCNIVAFFRQCFSSFPSSICV